MNRRALIIGGVAVLLLIALGVGAWYFFTIPSGSQTDVDPTPVPTVSELPGSDLLPTSSAEPTNSFVIPTETPTTPPLAFSGVCPDTWASGQDSDGDTLPDSVEAVYGAEPDNSDTDGDGYADGEEVRAGYDPLNGLSSARLDSDNDGLLDNEECIWGTDPFDPDSDNDGFLDGAEVENGYDPTIKGDGNGSDKLNLPAAATPAPQTPSSPSGQTPVTTPTPAAPSLSETPVQVTLIPFAQLNITTSAAPADIKSYMAQIDSLRPQELSDGTAITNAIQSAATGNVAALTQVRTRIRQFVTSLQGVPTPTPAQEYHQLYVSLLDFTVQRLQTIEQHATGDQQRAAQAVLDIQNTLPSYINRLASLRTQVEGIANQP